VVGLLIGRGDTQGYSSGGGLLGEVVPVGEGVRVGLAPLLPVLLSRFKLSALLVEAAEVAVVVSAGAGEPPGAGVLLDLSTTKGDTLEVVGSVGRALPGDLGVEVGEAGLEHGERLRRGKGMAQGLGGRLFGRHVP